MKILVADDSVVSRHLLEGTLRKAEYEPVLAADGNEAWKVLQAADPPRMAILDWMMPGLTGPEVCQLVRQANREPYTYILLLTSRSEREDLIEGMTAGADDYVTKPFDQFELKARLRAGRRIVELQAKLLSVGEALREQATRDSLTRCWNRSSILEILAREVARASRERAALGVVMVDLDHFKSVNDTFGHVVGDAVLCEATRRMSSCIRAYDALGRYGGEEFLVVLPGCEDIATAAQAERMRSALGGTPVRLEHTAIPLSGSFGAASVSGDFRTTGEFLVRTADDALLQSKRLGRNRVTHLPCPPAAGGTPSEDRHWLSRPAGDEASPTALSAGRPESD